MKNEILNFEEESISAESVSLIETQNFVESSVAIESAVQSEEPQDVDTNNAVQEKKSKPKSDKSKYHGVSAAMAGVVSAVFVAVTIIAGGVKDFTADFLSMMVYGMKFDYKISVNFEYKLDDNAYIDFGDVDTGLKLIVLNSVETQVISLVASSEDDNSSVEVEDLGEGDFKLKYLFSGAVSGLKEGTRYKVEIIGDDDGKTVVYAQTEIKTSGGAVTRFDSVEWKCNCLIDDTFRFKLLYIDENKFYSNFSYTLTPAGSGSSHSLENVLITDPQIEQIIPNINQLSGGEYVLTIKYNSSAYTDTGDSSGTKLVEKSQEINIAI